MTDQLFVGIDNGTQGTKVSVFSRAQKRILASAYRAHDMIENDAGRREQKPEWWITAADEALSECLGSQEVAPALVVAIGVSGQQHGCVALDSKNRVLRPAKLWCDTETVPQCEEITAALGGADSVLDLIGNSIAAGFTASKVLWLKQNEPDLYERLDAVLLPHDYLNLWLTGERKTECGDASGTAYFDVRKRCWSSEVLNAIDPSGKLEACVPEVIESDAAVGVIRGEIAERFGLRRDVIVSSGGGDNMMAAIGTGNVAPGRVTTSLGTSGTIYSFSDSPVIDPGGELAAFCSSSGGWLPLICTMNVTVATELTRSLLDLGVKDFDVMVEKSEPGAGGLLLLPYFNGERTPALPNARATLAGVSSTNYTRANLCRAAMEGATLGLRYGLDLLKSNGVTPGEIRLVGGGSNSRIWRQIIADVFNTPVICPESAEAGAMGCVLQAMWCADHQDGGSVTLAELASQYVTLDAGSRTEPSSSVSRYDEVYARYLALNNSAASFYD